MFDNLKSLAGLPGMLGKVREMQAKMQEVQGRLGEMRAEADAGGGMVTATCNGKLELVRLKIDSARLNLGAASAADLELLEDLIVAAVAAAQHKAADLARQEMSKAAQEAGLPPGIMEQLKGGID
jgi:DNA-binding YbaB/EbfC family protein